MALRKNAFLLIGLFILSHTWGVWSTVEVSMEDRVEVFRGGEAQITCMFTSNDGVGGLMIQWYYVTELDVKHSIYYQDATMQIVEKGTPFTGRISVNGTGATGQLVLTISHVRLQDELEFGCKVLTLTDGNAERRTLLKVFQMPEFPTIEGVHTGIAVNEVNPTKIGSCEAKNAYPRPNITWYRDNTPLQIVPGELNVLSLVTKESSGLFSVRSELAMRVMKEDKDARFYCEVTYFVPGETRMTESNRINITVHYPTTEIKVWVESPKGEIKEGDTVEIQCRGDGYPQPPFTFKYQNSEMDPLPPDSPDNVMVLTNVTRLNNGLYQCVSLDVDTFEDIMGNTSLVVNFLDDAVLIPNSLEISQREGLEATCNALSSLSTDTVWFKNGKKVEDGHILRLKDAVYDTAGTYECVVTVPEIEGMRTSGTLRVLVRGPPEISGPESTAIEENVESTVNLTCHARGYPVPSIRWSSSDAQVLKSVSRETEDGVHSVASVKVTSDITAFCNASNDQGTAAVVFTIKAKGNGVVIAVIIIIILLLAILGSVLYFLYKKGKICGRSGKQDLTKEKSNKDIVVEMKSDNTEEAVLLGVNGEKKPPSDQ